MVKWTTLPAMANAIAAARIVLLASSAGPGVCAAESNTAFAAPPKGSGEVFAGYEPVPLPAQVRLLECSKVGGGSGHQAPGFDYLRLTAITDRLLRLQALSEAALKNESSLDAATTFAVSRRAPEGQPAPTVTEVEVGTGGDAGCLVVSTAALKVTLCDCATAFVASSSSPEVAKDGSRGPGLVVESKSKIENSPGSFSWNASSDASGNLGGTLWSLDMIDAQQLVPCPRGNAPEVDNDVKQSLGCVLGPASKDGWSILNDTAAPVFPLNAAGAGDDWWDPRGNGARHDVYFFGHGRDYLGALLDFRSVGGVVPLPPKQASGVIWTRWLDYSSVSTPAELQRFDDAGFPVDVWLWDMNWHDKRAWGSYSWDRWVP